MSVSSNFCALMSTRSVCRVLLHEMQRAVDNGAAKVMGNLPDAPVSMNGEFWSKAGDDWVAIESADTIAFLRDADRRMAMADQAVDDIESS